MWDLPGSKPPLTGNEGSCKSVQIGITLGKMDVYGIGTLASTHVQSLRKEEKCPGGLDTEELASQIRTRHTVA